MQPPEQLAISARTILGTLRVAGLAPSGGTSLPSVSRSAGLWQLRQPTCCGESLNVSKNVRPESRCTWIVRHVVARIRRRQLGQLHVTDHVPLITGGSGRRTSRCHRRRRRLPASCASVCRTPRSRCQAPGSTGQGTGVSVRGFARKAARHLSHEFRPYACQTVPTRVPAIAPSPTPAGRAPMADTTISRTATRAIRHQRAAGMSRQQTPDRRPRVGDGGGASPPRKSSSTRSWSTERAGRSRLRHRILDIVEDGLDSCPPRLMPTPDDVYVSSTQVRRFGLRIGDRSAARCGAGVRARSTGA